MKILVADDDLLSRRLLEKTLQRAGYDVVAVENGSAAVEQLCDSGGPRLALLDWEMPELDGPSVCRAVRKIKDQSYVYMILLTSKGLKADVVAGLGAGADDYLTKPFFAEELKARLRTGQRILHLEGRLVEAREELRFRATHDALTSIFNRGVIMDLLGREVSRSRRENIPMAILLCDLDHFKRINDSHGHLTGDDVLKEATRRLLLSVRSYDYVGRFGGEEFLVILNNCPAASAAGRAEEIRRAMSSSPVQTNAGPLSISISVGVHQTDNWGSGSVEELLHEVDSALYAAKAAGRNCIKFAKSEHALDGEKTRPAETAETLF
ncbi:MAG: diguanylate cyclase [Acidobacteriota bacterium]|nr:diguanylate cyclase [Acidobacteriota bacterium]